MTASGYSHSAAGARKHGISLIGADKRPLSRHFYLLEHISVRRGNVGSAAAGSFLKAFLKAFP